MFWLLSQYLGYYKKKYFWFLRTSTSSCCWKSIGNACRTSVSLDQKTSVYSSSHSDDNAVWCKIRVQTKGSVYDSHNSWPLFLNALCCEQCDPLWHLRAAGKMPNGGKYENDLKILQQRGKQYIWKFNGPLLSAANLDETAVVCRCWGGEWVYPILCHHYHNSMWDVMAAIRCPRSGHPWFFLFSWGHHTTAGIKELMLSALCTGYFSHTLFSLLLNAYNWCVFQVIPKSVKLYLL